MTGKLTGQGAAGVQVLAGVVEVELLQLKGSAVEVDRAGAGGHDDLDGSAQVLELGLGNVLNVEVDGGGRHHGELTGDHVDGALGCAGSAGGVDCRVERHPVQRAL